MSQRLRPGVLVARAREVAYLDGLLAEAANGRGRVVLLTGEPGVGKSRLIAEQVKRARAAGMPALVGRPVESGSAFRPLADALLSHQRRSALPSPSSVGPFAPALGRLLPGWLAPQGEQPRADEPQGDLPLLVSEGLVRLLRVLAAESGVLFALDDLQWADADTLTVLQRLAHAVADLPVLLLLAARDGTPTVLERLRVVEHMESLPVRRLPPADAAALALSCAGDRPLPRQVMRHVVDAAEGLPFLVEELLRSLVDSGVLVATPTGWEAPNQLHPTVPASFAAVVHQRLDRLDETARHVAEVAACLGRSLDWRLLVVVTGQDEPAVLAALRRIVDVGLLVPGDPGEPDVFRFVHALTREAVRERLLAPQRAALVRTAAPLVEQAGHRLLAAHLHAEAGDPQRAARLLLDAAEAEGAALASREELLRRASALVPDDPDVGLALVEVLALAGRAVEACELGDPLLGRLGPDDPRRPDLALVLARACVIAMQLEQAHAYLGQAAGDPAVAATRAHVAFLRGRPDEAEELAHAAATASEGRVRCEALEILGRLARLRDQPQEAHDCFGQALQVAEQNALPMQRVSALAEQGTLDMLGPALHERLEQARLLALQSGQLWTAAMLQRQVAACHALRMDHARTVTTAEDGIELAESLRLPVLVGGLLTFVAMAYGHTGRAADLHATLDEAERRLKDDVNQLAAVHYVRYLPDLVKHDLESVLVGFEEGSRLIRSNAAASPTPYRGLHALIASVLADGGFERADVRDSGATVQASNRGALAYAEAVAAGRAGRDPAAHLALAEQVMEPLTWRRHHCRLILAPAALRDGWGSPQDWLREGSAYFEQRGEESLARACREQLRLAGARVPRRDGDGVVPLDLRRSGVTAREFEVLELVARGLTSSAIAQQLFLSSRTVETHVARLLAKTGAGNRRELRKYVPPEA